MDTITLLDLTWGLDGKVIICFCIFLLVTHLEHACVVSGKKNKYLSLELILLT